MKETLLRLFAVALSSTLVWLAGPHGADAGVNVWTTNGPAATRILVLAIDPESPTTIYAGALYDDIYVDALAIDPLTPTTLYAGTHGSGVFKSIDAGGRWTGSHAPAPFVLVQAIDPVTPSTIYAGTELDGLFKSSDGGAAWSGANAGLPMSSSSLLSVTSLAVDPGTPPTLYAGTSSVFKSTDGGGSWSRLDSGLPELRVNALAIDPLTP